MGSSHGKEQGPGKPFQALKNSLVTTKPTTLRVELSDINETLRLVDKRTGDTVFTIEPSHDGLYHTIFSASSGAIATLGFSSDAQAFLVHPGEKTTDKPVCMINARLTQGMPHIFRSDFTDLMSGHTCRVLSEGDVGQRNVTVYFERGPTLSGIKQANNERIKTNIPVGEIRRPLPEGDPRKDPEFMYIDAAPGVDLTLLTMLWITRYEIYVHSRKAAAGTTRMLMFLGAFAGASSC